MKKQIITIATSLFFIFFFYVSALWTNSDEGSWNKGISIVSAIGVFASIGVFIFSVIWAIAAGLRKRN